MNAEIKTNVIKRNGEEVAFDLEKIVNAIKGANKDVDKLHRMNEYQIMAVADNVAKKIEESTHAVNVEDIQDMVETGIMELRGYEVAQKYVRYRYKRELMRKTNTTDNGILALLDHMNEEVNQENSNKNPVINSTQRDYMAGEVSKDLSRRVLLPEEVVRAHEAGIIHFHDSDYFAQKEHNCDLINLHADLFSTMSAIQFPFRYSLTTIPTSHLMPSSYCEYYLLSIFIIQILFEFFRRHQNFPRFCPLFRSDSSCLT